MIWDAPLASARQSGIPRGGGADGFADLDRSTPGYLTPSKRKARLPGAPIAPLAHDDRLRRGEFPPRQANSGLVEDPGFAPGSFHEP